MKRMMLLLSVVAILVASACAAFAAYPEKPIHVVNYVGPGGLMDVTSRKFVSVDTCCLSAEIILMFYQATGMPHVFISSCTK